MLIWQAKTSSSTPRKPFCAAAEMLISKSKTRTISLAISCIAGGGMITVSNAAEPVPSEVAAQVARSVVEITAFQCTDGNSRTGSGFVFQKPNQIVSDYHVVQGCGAFRVYFERAPGAPTKNATIARVLPKSDLALLNVSDPPNVPALDVERHPVRPDELYVAIGYSLQQPTLSNLDVGISVGSSILRDFLPSEIQQQLGQNTQIDINSSIIRFKSPLEPGMSGGPVTNASGKVVAIVAGGLQNGTVPASWGWPGTHLSSLLTSTISPIARAAASTTLFSMVKDTTTHETRQCGKLTFTKIATRSYGDISQTADDQAAVTRVAAISTRPQNIINQFSFDLWQHRESGATVAVPTGTDLTTVGDRCVAQPAAGQFQEVIQGEPATDASQIQAATMRFELSLAPQYAAYAWQPDIYLTSPGPNTRSDGLVVHRKGAIGVSRTTPNAVHIAETLMARNGTVVGVATINNSYGTQYQPCIVAPNSSQCQQVNAELTLFTKFVLAIQLSTYPVY
ncbi:trypsin-like peptidase domain-containing protein [Burkholderia pseudomallei]|uniref:S1 family peptidase n=2 Tax=Burkholderia pseudomallei TaxID=28450 RepID=UPI001AAFA339|nr:serine protease [Burkholderia pseudomallei]MBO2962252.1 trypsin-like peptidase domain-containing protein [Burkholderia pseudomallei]MBO7788228.1 trypsin-like peptidase domain-containing protein [Burkholderia pseudomallei]